MLTWNLRLLLNLTRLTSNIAQDSNAKMPCKWPIVLVNHSSQSLHFNNDNKAKVNVPEVDIMLVTPGFSYSRHSCLMHSYLGHSCSGHSCSEHFCSHSSGHFYSGFSYLGSSFGSSYSGLLSKSKPFGGSLSFFLLL